MAPGRRLMHRSQHIYPHSRWRGMLWSVNFLWMDLSWPQEAPRALLTSTITRMLVHCTSSTPTANPACACLSIPSCLQPQPPATGLVRSKSGNKDCEWTSEYCVKSYKMHHVGQERTIFHWKLSHPSLRLYLHNLLAQDDKYLGEKTCWKSANLLSTDAFEKQFFFLTLWIL